MSVPEWKWSKILMDFIVGLPKNKVVNDSVWVTIDRLKKSAHFVPMKTTCTTDRLARICIQQIMRLHEVPESIMSDRGSTFISRF